jgi:hypothetical protein
MENGFTLPKPTKLIDLPQYPSKILACFNVSEPVGYLLSVSEGPDCVAIQVGSGKCDSVLVSQELDDYDRVPCCSAPYRARRHLDLTAFGRQSRIVEVAAISTFLGTLRLSN